MKTHEQGLAKISTGILRSGVSRMLSYRNMKMVMIFLVMLIGLSACETYIFEGERPIRSRDRIIGSHYAEEYSETYHEYYEYSVWISAGNRSNEVYIENLYLDGLSVYARVSYDGISIPFQVIDGYEIEGNGTIYGDRIDLNYYVRDRYMSTVKDFCETTLWKDNYYAGRKAERKRNASR